MLHYMRRRMHVMLHYSNYRPNNIGGKLIRGQKTLEAKKKKNLG